MIEAMKQALEALETCMYPQQKQMQAITSLRQAIAEVEAEKVEYAYVCVGCDYLSWANNFSCDCQVPSLMKFNRVKVIREST